MLFIGFSGGVDSTVLVHKCLDKHPVLLHFNHQMMEQDERDEAFCINFARQHKLRIIVGREDVRKFAIEHKHSIEKAARICRHRFFSSIMNEHPDAVLALAHHAGDRAETFLMNFMRGASVQGLSAMKAVEPDRRIIRPLLELTKSEIIKYAQDNNIDWVEDHTNAENDFTRNWLRNVVIAELEKRFPFIRKAGDTIKNIEMAADFIASEARKYLVNNKYHINVEDFISLHQALKNEIIAQWWVTLTGSRNFLTSGKINEIQKWMTGSCNGSKTKINGLEFVNRNGIVTASVMNNDVKLERTRLNY